MVNKIFILSKHTNLKFGTFIMHYKFFKNPPMIVKEIVCELLVATHIILFIQSRLEKIKA